MRIIFFYMLLGVLTADGLMVFLTPVIVYQLTTSIEYAGLTYALWWLPRLFLIPLIGKYIDDLGVRPISIISDSCKIIGCLFLLLTYFTSDLMIAISFGLVGSLISIGNSQTLISYEKIIALISHNREHHINIMSRIDFLGMIIGPLIGIVFIDFGYQYLIIIPCMFYFINAIFFLFFYIRTDINNKSNLEEGVIFTKKFIYIISSPILLFSIFIDIVAGIFGVLGTYLYSYLNQYISRILLIIISISIITISSSLLVFFQSSITIFIICYAISIIGKVFSGNILRLLRIEIIPINQLASISSLMILLNQMILPIVGGLLFFSTGEITFIYTLMIIAIGITLINGILLVICLKRSTISS
ncbi:MFS transporter [Proteus faecis]|uniref:MFS transporter n=1 Tax=Proteus faecis TaxID=2050967 RepID=A0AAW7CN03_9GAMM|nr:MFS transporter [Proteus faecis]MDL5167164.1 MFS transporter [Proteus faecis]MDL5275182.1 MFS transporter [Proteus faecis]MDL5278751.1 MFS transporter [Proteus faecis]MDL5307753.1 MFS transporter [Proteus faecis]MDL5311278.1 MFS transporter [Proteus faecis]